LRLLRPVQGLRGPRAPLQGPGQGARVTPRRRQDMDYTLLAAALTLLCVGLVMVYSASAIWAEQHLGQAGYFFKRQLLWGLVSLVVMGAASRLDYNRYRGWVAPVFALTVLALIAALFSHPVAGVRRWVKLGPVGLQPAEFAKLTS